MRIILLPLLLLSKLLSAQQNIFSSPTNHIYQFNLFDKKFKGRVKIVSNYYFESNRFAESDTTTYISDSKGIYDSSDSSKRYLLTAFEDRAFEIKYLKSRRISQKIGGITESVKDSDNKNSGDSIFYYPLENLFVYQQQDSLGQFYYEIKYFGEDKRIKKIVYYFKKGTKSTFDILSFLKKERYSEMYEFTYSKSKFKNIFKSIKYYRLNKSTAHKYLYASNRYLYDFKARVTKIHYYQYNGEKVIVGDISYRYSQN